MKGRWLPLLLLCLILAGCGTVDTGGRLISAAEGAEAYSAALAPLPPRVFPSDGRGYPLRGGEPRQRRGLL